MPRGRGGSHGSRPPPRSVMVSKALSRLLRHAAAEERIPIDNHGYVRMDHLLGWRRLRSMQPPVGFAEIVAVVQDNEKKRFALKVVGGVDETLADDSPRGSPEREAQMESETQRAIAWYETTQHSQSVDPKIFFIRATQGHSMNTVEAENLLTPISLDDEPSIPTTVVHGTFHGTWEQILQSGGLKRMKRNHVHFATGPDLQLVVPEGVFSSASTLALVPAPATGRHFQPNKRLGELLGVNKIISGMRHDAQILVYIDIRRALTEEPEMKWWRSENGVILTDGVAASAGVSEENGDGGEDGEEKLVPTTYFLAAVEVKEGVGVLYEAGAGVVRELPERLRNRGVPRGKGGGPRGGRGRGRG